MGTISDTDQIANVLFGKTRRTLLALLYGRVDESFYLRELARTAGVGHGAVQRELKALVEAGIINRKVMGRQTYFQANRENPVFGELKSLITKTVGVGDVLRAALAPLAERIDVAFIYGSIASGRERKSSDVDILIVGDVTFDEIISTLSGVEETLGREINPTVYPRKEFVTKLQAGHHFLTDVLKGEKIFLIGDQDGIERLAKERLDSRTRKQSTRDTGPSKSGRS